jgi:hypothetical protein
MKNRAIKHRGLQIPITVKVTGKDLEAVKRMYNALMAIGALNPVWLVPDDAPIDRAQEIANACMKEMNTNHTQLIARAIGLEGKRG